MPPNKKKVICIICLKRFLPPNNNSEIIPIVEILPTSFNPECGNVNLPSATTQLNVVDYDPYTRFLLFVKRYFKLTTFADRLLACAREAKNENGERVKLHTFCDSCGQLVTDICKLYKQLQTAQLFLIWKLSLVGELMKKASGHATDDKTYKSWGARSSMAKQMNVIAVKPVDLFRKALQLKCVNVARNGRTKPVVAIYRGLSPEQWKFNYFAVKEVLIRLIAVFTLASTELSEDRPKSEVATITEKVVEVKNFRKRRRRGHTKRKIIPSQNPENKLNVTDDIAVKVETENIKVDVPKQEIGLLGDNDDEEEAPPPLENLGNDSDWSRGAPSPMSVCSNVSDGGNHDDIQPTVEAHQKLTMKLRNRRKVFVKVEEEDEYDVSDNENDTQTDKELPKKFKLKEEATLKCPHCPALFVKPRGLGQHLRGYHQKHLNYSCKNCGMRFKKHLEFMNHHRKMHPKVPAELSNDIPGGISTPRRRLRRKNGVTKYVDTPYIPRGIVDPCACTQCSKVFSTRKEMVRHRKRVHMTKWNKVKVYWRVLEMDKRFDPMSPPPSPEALEEPDNIFVKGKSGRPKRNYLNQKELKMSEKYRKLDCEVESCGITCETAYLLRKHLESVHEDGTEESEKKVHCCYCDRKFVHQQSYEMHVRTVHRTKIFGTFLCDYDNCERLVKIPFASLSDLNEHLEYHLKQKSGGFKEISYCEKCNWGFLRPEVRDLHQLVHIPVEKDGRIPCSKCEERCLDMRTLQDHFIDKHELKGVKVHQCDACVKRYFTKNTFTRHKFLHERKYDYDPSNKLQCVICGDSSFRDKNSLDNHLKEHDPGYFIVCKEPGCGKKFGNKRKLQIHITNKHRVREWVCELCGEKYPKRTILMGHLNTHKEAQWPCDECGMKFKRKDKVKAHKLSMHNPDRVHAFVCSECGKGYHNPYGLKYHIDSTHKPESEWELKCPRCPRRFYRKLFLDMHLKKCEGGGDDGVNVELKGKETRDNSRKRKRKERCAEEEREISGRSTTDNDKIDEKPEISANAQNEDIFRTAYQQGSSDMHMLRQNQHIEAAGNLQFYPPNIPFLEQTQQRRNDSGV